jgi:hypothetical protein
MPFTEIVYAPWALVLVLACAPVASVSVTVALATAVPRATVPLTVVAVTAGVLDDDAELEPPPQPPSWNMTRATAAAAPLRTNDRCMKFPDASFI